MPVPGGGRPCPPTPIKNLVPGLAEITGACLAILAVVSFPWLLFEFLCRALVMVGFT